MKLLTWAALGVVVLVQPAIASNGSNPLEGWYTMTSAGKPWGYYHERMETKDARYQYRYEMVRTEGPDRDYEENVGAVAELDLTPVAWNLNKAQDSGVETINGSLKKGQSAHTMMISINGARKMSFSRSFPKQAILEVFFPLWFSKNIGLVKKKPRGSILLFSEVPNTGDFSARPAAYTYKRKRADADCHEIEILADNVTSVWCITDAGATHSISFDGGKVTVKKVAGQAEAKAWLGR